MLRRLSVLFLAFFTTYSYGQVCLGSDTTVCVGENVQIQNCGGINLNLGTGVLLNNATQINLSDDSFSGAINIGFTFNFYGTNYTQCVIGSNGVITFNMGKANGYNAWSLNGTPLPNVAPDDARNSVMPCYHDINPGQGGQVFYKTVGTAPNREFYVLWANIPMFSSGQCSYQAAVFYETSNIIEVYLGFKPVSPWNGGLAIQGIQNAAGNVAHIVPGRNNTQWTANNDAQRFTPTAPNNTNNYTISQIPYKAIISDNINFAWSDTNGQTYPYNNGVLNITNVPAGTTGYFLTVAGSQCSSQVGAVSDTTNVTGVTSSVSVSVNDDICSVGVGSATATPLTGQAPYSYVWPSLNNATGQTVNNLVAGTYQVVMTDALGCVSNASATVGDTPASYTNAMTPESCVGNFDGTATVQMVPPLGNVSYQWNDPNNQTTQTATGLAAGTYEVLVSSDVGCSTTIEVTVDMIPPMQVNVVNQTDVTCNSGNDGTATVNVTQGTGLYSYSWGSPSNSTSVTANDLDFGTQTVTITDSAGCVTTFDVFIDQPDSLHITAIASDTIVCIGDSALLSAQGAGGSSAYTYTWMTNGVTVGVGQNIWVTPTAEITQYCVVLSEACGSPTATACTIVSWPPSVELLLNPDKTGDCFPVAVNFENISVTDETIVQTIWQYSDGQSDTIAGMNPVSHTFGEGIFDVGMLVTTQRGCVYYQNFPSLIEGYSNPVADFYVNPNPASMFDPTVHAHSQSEGKIVSYQWYTEGGTPAYSSLQAPIFTYPTEVQNYDLHLTVENEHGCLDSIVKVVRIQNDVILYAPNTFTPDGDGYNEIWRVHISGIDIYNFTLEIFNRWGEKIFESHDIEGAWDGTYGNSIVPNGSYIWKIRAYDYENDNKYEFEGVVNVIN